MHRLGLSRLGEQADRTPFRWGRYSLALIAACTALFASDDYSHRVWRIEDGLPSNRIQAIAQTSDGYLWVGTSGGLARFDGIRFVVFDTSNTASLRDDSILALTLAKDGALWIGTEGGGLLRYASGAFRSFGPADGLSNGFVRSVFQDLHGTIWVGTDRGFFQMEADHFTRMDNTPQVPLASVRGIAADRTGQVWAGTSAGLLTVSGGKLIQPPCRGAPDTSLIRSLHQARNGSLWTIDTNGFSTVSDGCRTPNAAPRDVAFSTLEEDHDGGIWAGTPGQGLFRFRDGKLETFKSPSVLPDNAVTATFEDRDWNLWVGGEDGLLRLSKTGVGTIGVTEGLADAHVTSVYADPRGELWITTYTGQLYKIREGRPVRVELPSVDTNLLRPHIVFEDSKASLWLGSNSGGAVHLDRGNIGSSIRQQGLRSDNVRQIFEDKSNNIWFATGSGLSRWDGKSIRNYYLQDGLSYPSVRCMAANAAGDLVVGTDAGLNIVHEGEFVSASWLAELKQEKIWAILADPDGTLWLGTRGGGLIRARSGITTRYTARQGLISNSIYAIVNDGAGNLWMSSPAGVFSVPLRELEGGKSNPPALIHAVPYGTSDGMLTNQMSGGVQPASARSPNGDLWFPSLRGAVRIDPRHVRPQHPVPVLIEQVVDSDGRINPADRVEVPAGHNRLEIDYTVCNLTAPQRVSFQYKLEGFDDSWTPALRNRAAYYTNLPPGNYRFVVVATDASSPLHPSQASVTLVLLPSFYQTKWFYGLCGLFVVLLILAGLRIYHQQTSSKYALLVAERTRLAREMHDTVIQGCVGVSTLLEAAGRMQHSDPVRAAGLLEHARTEVKETLHEARQAVWDLRNPFAAESGVTALLALAKRLGSENAIQVDTELEGNSKSLDPGVDRTLLLVGREALRNSVTHGHPARIALRIAFRALDVILEVTDNGEGFETGRLPAENGHFGLIGMRERVERLGGSLTIRSAPGEGTKVLVTLPLGLQSKRAAAPGGNGLHGDDAAV